MIKIPPIITTDENSLKFIYRAIELLRLEHNIKGKDFRNGKITEKVFRDYQKNDFELRNQKLFGILNPIKERLGIFQMPLPKDPNYNPDDSRLKLEKEGSKEIKWDNYIDITKI